MATRIIALVDKTVVRIKGLEIKGVLPNELEGLLTKALGRVARVIGVAGDSLEFDVYGLDPEAVQKGGDDLIKTIALAEGVKATEVAQVDMAEKVRTFEVGELAARRLACAGERARL